VTHSDAPALDTPNLHRPKPTPPCFVPQIRVLVGRTNEYALARLDYLPPAIAWAIPFGGAGDEGLQQRSLSPVHGVHLRNLDQPLARGMLAHVLAGRQKLGILMRSALAF
jgi:hypothetical protein